MAVITILTMECNECGLLLGGGFDTDVSARLGAMAEGWKNVGGIDGDEWWICPECLANWDEERDGEPVNTTY